MSIPKPGFPLHRLNTAQTRAWVKFPNARAFAASQIAKKYGNRGAGLLDANLFLFTLVRPNGTFEELPPPYKQFEMWQVDNAPHYWEECACRNYYDPEVGGPWRVRGPDAGHHPFCQFSKTAVPVYRKCYESATSRAEKGLVPQARPDEWINAQQEEARK